ncbi:hypothetical protein GBAR_LOCUS4477, partial [Geodia barretti]
HTGFYPHTQVTAPFFPGLKSHFPTLQTHAKHLTPPPSTYLVPNCSCLTFVHKMRGDARTQSPP